MSKNCTDINQQEQLRYWVQELTHFSPQQVEDVLERLRTVRQVQRSAPHSSASPALRR